MFHAITHNGWINCNFKVSFSSLFYLFHNYLPDFVEYVTFPIIICLLLLQGGFEYKYYLFCYILTRMQILGFIFIFFLQRSAVILWDDVNIKFFKL